MSIELRRPQFSGTDREKLQQMHSYIYQLVDQLQYAFSTVETTESGGGTTIIQQTVTQNTESRPSTPEDAEATFAAIKNLIIKSGDIVDAYYEEINERLISSNEYVMYNGDNGFNKFREKTITDITKNSDNITIEQNRISEISSVYKIGDQYATITREKGYIKAGFLNNYALEENPDESIPEYGIEIGYFATVDDVERERNVGRFTSSEVVLYDPNGNRGAWLSANMLHAGRLEASREIRLGKFVDKVNSTTGSVVTYWVG